MDRKHQTSLLIGAIQDYQLGLLPLNVLIGKIAGLVDVIQDSRLKEDIFDSLLALEEVNALMLAGGFDFENNGKHVVERAAADVLRNAEAYRGHENHVPRSNDSGY